MRCEDSDRSRSPRETCDKEASSSSVYVDGAKVDKGISAAVIAPSFARSAIELAGSIQFNVAASDNVADEGDVIGLSDVVASVVREGCVGGQSSSPVS
ncbi:hypothetical protein GN958_ATG06763 [Phytophthora infestans]|uniref:Uncharacterized protein n=1 Tax=Phytophthora infestans TaxID=4787 RepID=A0A8S9USU6_PHYIN|nr:hypothetical protein GN958_ATG06763 [Phytophthora infestans]